MKLLLPLITLLLLLAGCADPRVDWQLARAEAAMMTAPDSAAAVLDSIEPSRLRGRQAALHALLRTHANYRNYVVDTDDSLINIAVDYYTAHPDPSRLMVAYYCRGRVRDYARRYPEAMTDALRSLDLATTLDDPFYQARAHELMGDIWCLNNSHHNYIAEAKKASYYYTIAQKHENAKWASLDAAIGHINTGEFDTALKMLDSLKNNNLNDKNFCRYIQKLQIPLLNKKKKFDQSTILIDSMLHDIGTSNLEKAEIFANISQTYSQTGQIKDAIRYLDSARHYLSADEPVDYFIKNAMAFSECLIYSANGQTDSVIASFNKILKMQDSIITESSRENLTNAVSEYLIEKNSIICKQKNMTIGMLICLIILALTLLVLSIVLFNTHIRRRNAKIKDNMAELAALASKYENLDIATKAELISNERAIRDLQKLIGEKPQCRPVSSDMYIRLAILKQLGNIFTMFCDDEKKAKNKLWSAVKSIIETTRQPNYINELLKVLDSDTKGLLSAFMPVIKGRSKNTTEIFVYTVAGLSTKEISLILEIPVSTVYSIKSSIKDRINASPEPRKAEMLHYFN